MALIMVSKTNCKQLFLAVSLMMTLPVQAELLSAQLVKAALERTAHVVRYDGSYRSISYPNGDVPDNIGVCTDVVIRSYRKLGIDHRRVPNLQAFFSRHGESLEVSSSADNYLPGDLVTWMLPGNLPHIGIVTDQKSPDHLTPLIVHNIGAGPRLENILFSYEITGHYRYLPGN